MAITHGQSHGLVQGRPVGLVHPVEELGKITQRRQGLTHLLEGEGRRGRRSGRQHGLGRRLLRLGGLYPSGNDLGRDASLESVEVLGQLALVFGLG